MNPINRKMARKSRKKNLIETIDSPSIWEYWGSVKKKKQTSSSNADEKETQDL